MKKIILVLVALVGLVGSVSADTFAKRWGETIVSAEVKVKTLGSKSTVNDAYHMVSDKYNHTIYLPVFRSGFISELAERDYKLNKEKISLIFLKNWKMNDEVMQATCIVWFDKNRGNWLYICLEEL